MRRGEPDRSRAVIENLIARGDTAYGVNTGFGRFVNRSIPEELTEELRRALNHYEEETATGSETTAPLSDEL